jgi:hypothetical protein
MTGASRLSLYQLCGIHYTINYLTPFASVPCSCYSTVVHPAEYPAKLEVLCYGFLHYTV